MEVSAVAQGHKMTHPKKRAFLAAYAISGNVTDAAERAGIERKTHYRWLSKDSAYAEAFKDAEEEAADRLEAEARRRATQGVDEPVFYKGYECGTITRYSDALLMFLLKGARPEKYKERVANEHSGPDGGPVAVKVDLL